MRYLVAISLLALSLLLSVSIGSAQTLKLAIVNMDTISKQYQQLGDEEAKLQSWVRERRALLQALEDFMYVSKEEFEEIARLMRTTPDQWNEEQKKREADIRRVSENNERRYTELQNKVGRTAEETNTYNTLRETLTSRLRDHDALAQAFTDELNAKGGEAKQKLSTNVQAVIAQVAKEQALTAVFDDAVVLFFSADVKDITEDVLKALNAAVAPAPPAEGGGGAAPAPAPAQ